MRLTPSCGLLAVTCFAATAHAQLAQPPFPLRWDVKAITPQDNSAYRLYRLSLTGEPAGEVTAVLANGRGNAVDRACVQVGGVFTEPYPQAGTEGGQLSAGPDRRWPGPV